MGLFDLLKKAANYAESIGQEMINNNDQLQKAAEIGKGVKSKLTDMWNGDSEPNEENKQEKEKAMAAIKDVWAYGTETIMAFRRLNENEYEVGRVWVETGSYQNYTFHTDFIDSENAAYKLILKDGSMILRGSDEIFEIKDLRLGDINFNTDDEEYRKCIAAYKKLVESSNEGTFEAISREDISRVISGEISRTALMAAAERYNFTFTESDKSAFPYWNLVQSNDYNIARKQKEAYFNYYKFWAITEYKTDSKTGRRLKAWESEMVTTWLKASIQTGWFGSTYYDAETFLNRYLAYLQKQGHFLNTCIEGLDSRKGLNSYIIKYAGELEDCDIDRIAKAEADSGFNWREDAEQTIKNYESVRDAFQSGIDSYSIRIRPARIKFENNDSYRIAFYFDILDKSMALEAVSSLKKVLRGEPIQDKPMSPAGITFEVTNGRMNCCSISFGPRMDVFDTVMKDDSGNEFIPVLDYSEAEDVKKLCPFRYSGEDFLPMKSASPEIEEESLSSEESYVMHLEEHLEQLPFVNDFMAPDGKYYPNSLPKLKHLLEVSNDSELRGVIYHKLWIEIALILGNKYSDYGLWNKYRDYTEIPKADREEIGLGIGLIISKWFDTDFWDYNTIMDGGKGKNCSDVMDLETQNIYITIINELSINEKSEVAESLAEDMGRPVDEILTLLNQSSELTLALKN